MLAGCSAIRISSARSCLLSTSREEGTSAWPWHRENKFQ
jgi:hypothetical protein